MESKKDYLRRILNIDSSNYAYAEMDTYLKEYNNFIKSFNFDEIRSGEIEKIFLQFHEEQLTPAQLVKKQKGKAKLQEQLNFYLKEAKKYYDNTLYPKYYLELSKISPSDAMIEMQCLENNNNLTGELANVNRFISHLDELWESFKNSLYKTVDLIFSGRYDKDGFIRINEFESAVNEEISFYQNRIIEYEKSFDDSGTYYVGKNDNPYKNIFLYCLNAFIKNFYPLDIICTKPGRFEELTKMVVPKEREVYSLQDIANLYCDMGGCSNNKKAYERMKHQFRKSKFMQEHKKDGKYSFDNVEIPLATYLYYKKKNHVEPKYDKLFNTYDHFIVHYYAPLLSAAMRGQNDNLKALNNFVNFVDKEFKKLTGSVNDAYLKTFVEELFNCTLRLFYRCLGMDVNKVIMGIR